MATLELRFAGILPLLSLPASLEGAERVFGAALSRDKSEILYPGFYPYCERVLADIKNTELNVVIPESVAKHIEQEANHKNLVLDPSFKYITKPFDHLIVTGKQIGRAHV